MEKTFQGVSKTREQETPINLARGIGWGLIGGLGGTMVMDLVLMGSLAALGSPALTCFSIVGNTVARFLSLLELEIAGGIPTGITAHYLIGPVFGAIYGIVVTQVGAFRVDTMKKCVFLAVLYIEILSQPILATTPILLKMTVSQTLQWYGGSFVMHLMMAVVLGTVVGYGLRLATSVSRR